MILHITTEHDWQAALKAGFYEGSTLQKEGFIHCCLPKQLAGVIQRYYAKAGNLIVLHIDERKLTAPLKYELSPMVPEMFPHVYGTINIDAVQTIEPLVC